MSEGRKDRRDRSAGEPDLRLDRLLDSLGAAFGDALRKLDEAGSGESLREVNIPSNDGKAKVVSQVRVRVGSLAQTRAPKAAPINPNRSRTPAPSMPEETPLDYDLFEDEGGWILTADLPGVTEADISLTVEGDTVVLQVAGRPGARARVTAPRACRAEDIAMSLRNGILTLRFPESPHP